MGDRDARVHTGRHDRHGRTGRRRRVREEQIDLAAPPTRQTALDLTFREAADQARKEFFDAIEEAEARHEGVDDVHPRPQG